MQKLIQAVLDYSRIQATELQGDPVYMNDVLKQVLSALGEQINEKGATIKNDSLPTVQENFTQLVEALKNLLENALIFHNDHLSPVIHLGVSSQNAKEWHFFVRDNGIGIDANYFPKLFFMFNRLHPRGKYPGTGVGLATCKKIIEQHGGRIWVESEVGKGSTSHFTLSKENYC